MWLLRPWGMGVNCSPALLKEEKLISQLVSLSAFTDLCWESSCLFKVPHQGGGAGKWAILVSRA